MTTLKKREIDLTEGRISTQMIRFFIPIWCGIFFQQIYITADAVIISKVVGESALAAVGCTSTFINLLIGFFVGIGSGATVVIAQYFGARENDMVRRATHTALALAAIIGLSFMVLGLFITPWLLELLQTPEDIFDMAVQYLRIYSLGMLPSVLYNMGSGILRAVGDSRHPLLYLAVASIVNIILDFTFVCGLHMGIAGVAIATIMAQAVSSFMVMHKLMHTREDYKVEIRKIRFHKKMIRKIIAFGFPAACQQSITSFSNVVVQSYINRFGTAAMAGYSATLRIDGFLQLPLQSFNMAITTFVGQNIGARKYKRVKKGIFAAWVMSSLIILAGSVGMYFGAPLLISVFTNDPQVIGNGSSMLRIFSRAYIVMPVIQVLNGALRGAGLSKVPMFFMLGSFVVLRQIYLLVAVPMTHSLMVVMAGWPITWVICAAGMFLYYVKADWLPKEAGPEGE